MRVIIAFSLLICLGMLSGQEATVNFQILPATINAGDSAELIWNVENTPFVYISGIGKVPSSGRQAITPENCTSYTLIFMRDQQVVTQTKKVVVQGSRGVTDFPERADFKFKRSYKLVSPAFIEFLDQIHNSLQNTLGFSLLESYDVYDRKQGQTAFMTKLSKKEYLVPRGKSKIRFRRIAYLVEVNEPKPDSNEITYSIDAVIQYQRRAENRWRPESDEELYLKEISKLQELIQNGSK